jgi:hypothetical protein
MHVGIIGGLDRAAPHYREVALRLGHSVECHTGDLAGNGPHALEAVVQRSDLVVIVTDVNSHGAVWQARRLSRRHGAPLVFVRRLGVARLRQLVEALPRGARTPSCAAGV